MIQAIPTRYAGHEFRSRLEARWAAMFDRCRWLWQYEPLDLPGWIPDFLLPGPTPPMLVEVKPVVDWPAFYEHRTRIARSGWAGSVLLVGALVPWAEGEHTPTDAVLGQLRDGASQRWRPAVLSWCASCDRLTFVATRCPWCSALATGAARTDLRSFVARRWAEAGNDTRWMPR